METRVVREKQDLTYLKWSHVRNSSGTAGTLLKSEEVRDGKKIYYKLSNFDLEQGVVGHECINEIIVDRLLTLLQVEHLHYELIHADIEVEGRVYETWLCASEDFKERGENKIALDDYYRWDAQAGESHYDFCVRHGWKNYVDQMLAVDFLIMNRDRHGANIEVLRNTRKHTLRLAPLFDHGLSLIFTCTDEADVKKYDILEDKRCQNFIGGFSCYENLSFIKKKSSVLQGRLTPASREVLFADLDGILPDCFFDTIWEMIYKRYQIYEGL
ncbi:MAG: hypothetical protein IJK17_01390 [Lachnospiraceae bacterium]|nr:hypothetical protein [Lachnospiraceae bacterium]